MLPLSCVFRQTGSRSFGPFEDNDFAGISAEPNGFAGNVKGR